MSFISSLGAWLRKVSKSFMSATISGKTITLTRHNGDTVTLTTQDTTYEEASQSTTGLMSAEDKAILDAIPSTYAVKSGSLTDDPIVRTSQSGREANIINFGSVLTGPDSYEIFDLGWNYANRDGALLGLRSSSHSTEPGYFKLYARDENKQSILQGTPNGELTWRDNQVITIIDTATATKNGVMTAADKVKLDGITAGAEPNQNAYASILVGNTNVAADTKSDTLTLVAGNNITLTPDATNDKITIAAKDTVTTVSTTGNGNAVTSITANNGALTVKKDSTFSLSNHTHDYFPLQTVIPNNSNLDNYKTTGIYYCSTNASAKTISNRPSGVNSAFTLVVLPSLGTQVLITFDGAIYKRWYRSWDPVAWASWVLIGPVPPYGINLGGTGQTTAYNAFKAFVNSANSNITNATINTTNLADGEATYRKQGNIVVGYLKGKLKSALSSYSGRSLATGFPTKADITGVLFPMTFVVFDSSTYLMGFVHITNGGEFLLEARATSLPTNTLFYCYFMYPYTL